MLSNKLSEDVNVREPGSSEIWKLKAGELLPLRYTRQGTDQQLCLCFTGMNNKWSAPFNISDIGRVHVKLSRAGERQKLLRVEILIEKATIFLYISIERNHWPFSFRNESDAEFIFHQADPYEDEDENRQESGWRPIKYRLPPRSIMPYAWDYPAANYKEIVLTAGGKVRHVKIAEIGSMVPMRIPPSTPQSTTKIIDINVVADGPTQALVISNFKASKSLYKQNRGRLCNQPQLGSRLRSRTTILILKYICDLPA